MKLIIKGGHVLDPAQGLNKKLDLLIEDGRIKALEKNIDSDGQVIEAKGKFITPGLIDMHVHLREPGFEYKEDIESGTRAAAMGGFTSIACMPNTNPVVDSQSIVEFIKNRAKTRGIVNVYPIGNITKGSKGQEIAEIAELKEAGVVGLSDDGRPVASSDLMRRAMEYVKMFNLPIISHSEDLSLVGEGVMNEGYMSTVLGLKGIPKAAEEVMIARDIILAEMTGCPLHLAHISTLGAVRMVREAKQRGVKVTAEATPHHFTLTDEAVAGYNTSTKVNPPLRTASDVEAIIAGLKDGTIDVIATDHAPHSTEEKDVEYNYAPFGMVGLETAVGLVMTELVAKGHLSLMEAIAKLSVNPAKVLGIGKGTLKVGSQADITIIDPELTEIVSTTKFQSKGKNSPFDGWELKGLPITTIVNGKIVMRDRELV